MKVIVKPGAEVPHGVDGKQVVLTAGAIFEVAAHIAHEIRHLVDEYDEVTQQPKPIGGVPAEAQLASELERALPHERITLIEQAIEAGVAGVEALRKRLAEAKAAVQPAKPAAAATAPPADKKDETKK